MINRFVEHKIKVCPAKEIMPIYPPTRHHPVQALDLQIDFSPALKGSRGLC